MGRKMVRSLKKNILFGSTIILVIMISNVSAIHIEPRPNPFISEPFFTLVAKMYPDAFPCDSGYMDLIQQYLGDIGIAVDVLIEDWPVFIGELCCFRDYDMFHYVLKQSDFTHGIWNVYNENGTYNFSGYHTSMDWDENLSTGKNEWYIQTGKNLNDNISQEAIDHSWWWQDYLMDEILPCLPLFTKEINNNSCSSFMLFNMRESRPVLGSRHPCPGYESKTQGLAIRKVISYAINREEIRRVVLGDEYEIYNHPINPINESWLNPNGVKYCHDLIAAKDFMKTYGLGGGWTPGDYVGYGNWPKWEDVCSKNLTTRSSPGYEIYCAVIILIVLSQVFLIKRIKTLKEKKTNKKGGI